MLRLNTQLFKSQRSILNNIRFLSIKTYTTPNENALKFEIDQDILPNNQSYQFNIMNQHKSPLASKIFEYSSDVENILIGSNFITINKNEFANWNHLTPLVKTIIEDHITKQSPILSSVEQLNESQPKQANKDLTDEELEIGEEVAELIETRIRPSIQQDGGDLIFLNYKNGKVYVQLQGACTSCSLSDETLKNGILSMLNHYIEGIDEVVNIADLEFNKFEEKLARK